MTTIEDANFALQKVLDSGSQKNVIELGWIKNVRVNKRFLVFSLEFLGGSFNMYLVNLEEKKFFWLIISFSL